MAAAAFVFIKSNTTGTGALFARAAAVQGLRSVPLSAGLLRYPFVARGEVEAIQVGVQDRGALLAAGRRLRMNGGLAGVWSSSEYLIAAAAELARELGLPGPDEAVSACSDKGAQRVRLAGTGVKCPTSRIVASVDDAVAAAGPLGGSRSITPPCAGPRGKASRSTSPVSIRVRSLAAPSPAASRDRLRSGAYREKLRAPAVERSQSTEALVAVDGSTVGAGTRSGATGWGNLILEPRR